MLSKAVSGRKLRKGLIALTLFIFTFVMLYPQGKVSAITLSEEKDLGKKFVRMIRKTMPLVEDGEVLTY
ncbi:MAG: hypothetical protein WAN11_09695, partial [Syntrophobacteraceae bacterium]